MNTGAGMDTQFVAPPSRVPGVAVGPDLHAGIPSGDPAEAWQRAKDSYRLIGTGQRKNYRIAVVGTGLAGCGAAVSLAELGYRVEVFTLHDAPRRAHSVAAQGGINAARARRVDGDSLHRFVVDAVKGGDFRGREADVFRLAAESGRVIDHLAALGTPFAREYGGTLATRSFGGVQVSRTYYSRGQTGQQVQIAGAQALWRQVEAGHIRLHTHAEMMDLIVEDGVCRGIIARDLHTGQVGAHPAHAVVLATGGYGSIYFHSTLAVNSNASAAWRAHQRGAAMASPSFVQFHPTALPVASDWQAKTILMSESLRNDGRIWVPARAGDDRPAHEIPEDERDYYLERMYPAYGNLSPRDVSSRAATERIRAGHGVGPLRNSVYLDFRDALAAVGRHVIAQRYGNLFHMYRQATGEDPYAQPMRIAPAAHFTMGGLWTDFELMTTIPGLFAAGEAGWTYHGANRLGANSLLSACVDGWFTIPHTVPHHLAGQLGGSLPDDDAAPVREAVDRVRARTEGLLAVGGSQAPARFHRRLGEILTTGCGVTRSARSLAEATERVRELRAEFWADVRIPGTGAGLNQSLEQAGRIADFLELGELMCLDAWDREESCGAHFRVEHQVDGEAARDDDRWAFASVWRTQFANAASSDAASGRSPQLATTRCAEPLAFRAVPLATRSYA